MPYVDVADVQRPLGQIFGHLDSRAERFRIALFEIQHSPHLVLFYGEFRLVQSTVLYLLVEIIDCGDFVYSEDNGDR